MSKAMESLLDAVVRELTDQVKNGTKVADKDGNIETVSTPAAILNVARQLCKDHNIELPKESDGLKTLVSTLPFDTPAQYN